MSDTPPPPPPYEHRPPSPDERRGCTAAFMVATGIILLLPGLCTEVFWGLIHVPNTPVSQNAVIVFAIALFGTALAVLGIVIGMNRLAAGIILLLPGACTVIVTEGRVGQLAEITPITFAIGFLGLILILLALVKQ